MWEFYHTLALLMSLLIVKRIYSSKCTIENPQKALNDDVISFFGKLTVLQYFIAFLIKKSYCRCIYLGAKIFYRYLWNFLHPLYRKFIYIFLVAHFSTWHFILGIGKRELTIISSICRIFWIWWLINASKNLRIFFKCV